MAVRYYRTFSVGATHTFADKKASKMNHLPVSRKVYADITSRISTALAPSPASVVEAMRLVDSFLHGESPASHDLMAMLAFGMIRAELERAMARSRKSQGKKGHSGREFRGDTHSNRRAISAEPQSVRAESVGHPHAPTLVF